MAAALFATVCLIAACGLVYELVAGALASYLLGDSVTQFSLVIGIYLASMGVGSWLSRFVVRGLAARFVAIELLVAIVGGWSASLLFLAFAYTEAFRVALYAIVTIVGILVGLEVPLLMRLLRERFAFKDVVANVLTFDYLGALIASILFPLVLVPHLGLVRAALGFGIVNAVVALWSTWLFRGVLGAPRALRTAGVAVLAVLVAGFAAGDRLMAAAERGLYADDVIFARSTPYQRIVLTVWKDDLRLYLNNHLQFSSRDEYRYHEALVHPGLAANPAARRVLVLGGGDGLALREILRYPGVSHATLVDLDGEMTRLFTQHRDLAALNGGSFRDPRVTVHNADAFTWLDAHDDTFDFIVVDFPDPSNYAVGKLYTTAFYRLLKRHLARDGRIVVQSTSPLFARASFWCIERTLREADLATAPYHLYVPSFGEWGFVLAGAAPYVPPDSLPAGLRFLTRAQLLPMFDFPLDMRPLPVEPNRLNDQVLVRYYEKEFEQINR
ncbi:MAG: polyamine aminopropyltransferase [Gemmatimonadetes bacterium]|nr:polyamine aminopropyltransferase [Gemmatimonadota bacterium]